MDDVARLVIRSSQKQAWVWIQNRFDCAVDALQPRGSGLWRYDEVPSNLQRGVCDSLSEIRLQLKRTMGKHGKDQCNSMKAKLRENEVFEGGNGKLRACWAAFMELVVMG